MTTSGWGEEGSRTACSKNKNFIFNGEFKFSVRRLEELVAVIFSGGHHSEAIDDCLVFVVSVENISPLSQAI